MKTKILVVLVIFLFNSCHYDFYRYFYREYPVLKRINQYKDISDFKIELENPDQFNFLVVSDLHIQNLKDLKKYQTYLNAQINKLQPAFILCSGDLTQYGLKGEWQLLTDLLYSFDVPFYFALGNHDILNNGWEAAKLIQESSSLYFKCASLSFYICDNASGYFNRVQIDILEDFFSRDESPKIVMAHYPLYGYESISTIEESNRLLNLFWENNVLCYIHGHTHSPQDTYLSDLRLYDACSISGQYDQPPEISVFYIDHQRIERVERLYPDF